MRNATSSLDDPAGGESIAPGKPLSIPSLLTASLNAEKKRAMFDAATGTCEEKGHVAGLLVLVLFWKKIGHAGAVRQVP